MREHLCSSRSIGKTFGHDEFSFYKEQVKPWGSQTGDVLSFLELGGVAVGLLPWSFLAVILLQSHF